MTPDIIRELELDPDAPAASLTIRQHVEIQRRLLAPDRQPEPVWLKTKEAADYLRVSTKTLQRYARESDLIVRAPGAGRAPDRYRRDSLDAFIASRRRTS